MVQVKVELVNVFCQNTEDLTSADDFYLVGALVGGGVRKVILTRPVKINDRQVKEFGQDSLLLSVDIPVGSSIKGGLIAYDEDDAKDWTNGYGTTVDALAARLTDNTVTPQQILAAITPRVGILKSEDRDDLLGSTELEISATGPALEERSWLMSHGVDEKGSPISIGKPGFTSMFSNWRYTVKYRISRS